MKGKLKDPRFNVPVFELVKALNRLDPDQGTIARRNARRTVHGALRSLRSLLDKAFPIVKERTVTAMNAVYERQYKRRKTWAEKIATWRRKATARGWVAVQHWGGDKLTALHLSQCGIKLREVPGPLGDRKRGEREYWAPRWAVLAIGTDLSNPNKGQVALAKRDRKVRLALLATSLLTGGAP